MADAIETRLDEMAAKIAALEEEVATLGKRIRKLRKRTISNEREGQPGQPAAAADAE